MTGWWMLDESQCLSGCSTVSKSCHMSRPMGTQAIYSLHYPTQSLYWLHCPASCLVSSRTSSQSPVNTNWAAMGHFLYLKHRWLALYNQILLVHSVAGHSIAIIWRKIEIKIGLLYSVVTLCWWTKILHYESFTTALV